MKIKITNKHIKKGRKGEPRLCPIALAIKEQVKNIDRNTIMILYASANFAIKGKEVHKDLPKKATKFIHAFDSGEEVKPFEFNLKF